VREQLPFLDSQTLNSNNTKRVQKNDKFQKKKQQPTEPIPEELQNCILIKVSPINFKRYKTQAFRKDDQQVGKYVHFTLMKRNLDSINAGILISKFVGISNKHFAMAGIKDKRGITTQRASLQGITIEQLEEIQSRKNWNKNIVISDYKYSNTSLALGDLYGNRFAVSLRMVGPATVERKWEIARNIEHLKLHGFINYFGLQRFGVNREIKTHDIGRYVIRQQWKDVVNAMLKSACTSDPHTRQAIEQYFAEEPLNHRKLLRSLPMKLRLERMLL
jgi:tRNA pseudouridine13 synthase